MIALLLALTLASVPARTPVVVELFTSEGCSSCPPADDALRRLVREQPVEGAEVVALGLHVTYWNRLGWADPFSSPAYTQRQHAYSEAFGGDRIYTPQVVIDGQAEAVGSSPRVTRLIREAAARPKATVSLALDPGSDAVGVRVAVSGLPGSADAPEVLLAVTEDDLSSRVTRGENEGRTLEHAAVVRLLRAAGAAREGLTVSASLSLGRGWRRERLKVIAFVQEQRSRRILGAAVAPLPARAPAAIP